MGTFDTIIVTKGEHVVTIKFQWPYNPILPTTPVDLRTAQAIKQLAIRNWDLIPKDGQNLFAKYHKETGRVHLSWKLENMPVAVIQEDVEVLIQEIT